MDDLKSIIGKVAPGVTLSRDEAASAFEQRGLRMQWIFDAVRQFGAPPAMEVARRAVELANQLNADMAVVTGDLISFDSDPLEACIAELSRLRVPLGIWGCNGNHESMLKENQRGTVHFSLATLIRLRRGGRQ